MKIVHLFWWLENGGIENMLADIIKYQCESDEIHLVIVNNHINQSIYNRLDKRCTVHNIGRPAKSRNPYYIVKLNVLLWKLKPDVLHYHGDVFRFVKLPVKATVFTAHNLSWGEKHIACVDKCAAISSAVYKNLVTNGYSNVVQVDNGVDYELIHSRKKTFNGFLKIVQCGRLIAKYKGQDILINAADSLVKQGVCDFHVDFMGDGESRQMLENMVKNKHLGKYISFLGDCDRDYIYEHLADYDVFVQPSRWEGFGLTVAEAICAKLPIIVAKHEGPMQIIDNGKYGYVFDIEDVQGLVNKLIYLKSNYPSNDKVEAAYQYVVENFGIDKTAKNYLKLYTNIIQSKEKV